MKSVLLHITFI